MGKIAKVTMNMDILLPVEDLDLLYNMSLYNIAREVIEGGWSHNIKVKAVKNLEGGELQKECDKQGTDIGFFGDIKQDTK